MWVEVWGGSLTYGWPQIDYQLQLNPQNALEVLRGFEAKGRKNQNTLGPFVTEAIKNQKNFKGTLAPRP